MSLPPLNGLSLLINVLLLPFELLGAVIVRTFSFLRYFVRTFFLSPWGLLVPLTLIAAFVLVELAAQSIKTTATRYETELQQCSEPEIPAVFDILLRLDDNGIPPLVRCLASEREAVFTKANETLEQELDRWNALPLKQQAKKYRLLSENLSKYTPDFPSAGQSAALNLTQRILRELVAKDNAATSDFHQAAKNCEKLLTVIETARKKKIAPNGLHNAPVDDSLARFNQKPFKAELMANAGTPFDPEGINSRGTGAGLNDPFAAARADVLYAYHQSGNAVADSVKEPAPFPVLAVLNGKIAENYVQKHQPAAGMETLSPAVPLDNLLSNGIPDLPTVQLMKLLHHPNESFAAEAKMTLIGRDGFREEHLKLAYRLFHPNAEVRKEVITLLPSAAGTQPNVWLSVLLNDPDSNIRYQAASALATTGDPSMLRLVIDKAKRDGDERIVRLAEQLSEQQRSIRR
jgi:hypothetical protein